YEQDKSTKEDMIQRINKCLECIKEKKANVSKICEAIKKTDEEIAYYYKHSQEIKDCYSNWKPTCDVFHKHEDYMQDQLTIYQENNEKDKKMYHGYICQYENVLKQYQLKYSETRFSCKYYEKKKEHEEIQNRVLACTEQLKQNEAILMELLGMDILSTALVTACLQWKEYDHSQLQICFTVPAPFPSLTKWTLHIVNLRYKTQDILKCANDFTKRSLELEKEADDMEIEINSLNKAMYIEHFGKPVENNSGEEERTENFPQTPETPLFLRTPDTMKTPESVEKMQFPKSPFFEILAKESLKPLQE
ncbi:hypothetical protein A6R68_11036, partial [Neotoma lepida]